MITGTHNILTTHAGSLPRSAGLIPLLYQPPTEHFYAAVQQAVAEVVAQQIASGIHIISDGEQARTGFHLYVTARLSGFVFHAGQNTWMPQDVADHPDMLESLFGKGEAENVPVAVCEGPITMADPGAIQRDISAFKRALEGKETQYVEAFLTAASPGVIASTMREDVYYRDREKYVMAIAEAMAHDYQAIVKAGLLLQVDCPDLASDKQLYYADAPLEVFREHVRQSIRALNAALDGIPPHRVRVHVCSSNYPGTHHRDSHLGEILDLLLGINAQGLSVVAANGQHRVTTYQAIKAWVKEHGWPPDKVLIPGVIDTLTAVEEHPETVAHQLEQYVDLLGMDHVLAGTDCGFSTIVGIFQNIKPSAVWTRLAVLASGAKLASERLRGERITHPPGSWQH